MSTITILIYGRLNLLLKNIDIGLVTIFTPVVQTLREEHRAYLISSMRKNGGSDTKFIKLKSRKDLLGDDGFLIRFLIQELPNLKYNLFNKKMFHLKQNHCLLNLWTLLVHIHHHHHHHHHHRHLCLTSELKLIEKCFNL